MKDARYNSVRGNKIKQNLASSTSPRFYQNISGGIPGPGRYEIMEKVRIGPKFTLSKRSPLYQVPDSPSPGAYNIPSCFDSKKSFSFSPKQKKSENLTPGPGAYNPKDIVINTRRAVFGHEKRRDNFLNPELTFHPSPAQYTLNSTLSGPKWCFGSELSRKYAEIEDFPGPGSYNSPSTLTKLFHKFPSSRKQAKIPPNPGPGHYNPPSPLKFSSFAISRAEKFQKIPGPVLPGPSDYNIRGSSTLTPVSNSKYKQDINTSSTLLSDLV